MDLSKWKLALPVNKDGKLADGLPLSFSPAKTYKPYFVAGSTKWSFVCPTKGATSENSNYCRSELGQIKTWTLSSTDKKMSATLTVTANPDRIVVGQIHADKDELMKLFVQNGSLYVTNEHDFNTDKLAYYYFKTDAKVNLGQTFSYATKANKSTVTVTVTINGVNHMLSYKVGPYWLKPERTFKHRAGIYCVTASGSDAKVDFTKLDI